MNRYFTELVGTFFLTLTIALTGNPMAIGCTLIALIYMGYNSSGAHYNPAVTLAIYILKLTSGKEAILYVLAQIIGAALASVFFHLLYGNTRIFFLFPDHSINILKPLAMEAVLTFALVSVVLYTAANPKNSGNQFYGLAIGLVVIGLGYMGQFSGGAYNPAVGFVPIVFETFFGACSCNPITHSWIYITGPLLGGAAAALWFRISSLSEKRPS